MKLPRLIHEVWRHAFADGFDHGKKHALPFFLFSVGPVKDKPKTRMSLELKFTTEQQVTVSINPTTPKGQPAALDGVPTWQVASGDVTLQPAPDGKSCVIVSADTPGQSQVLVSADADLGSGVDTISDTISCLVSDPQASSLGLTASPPENKP